MHDGIYDNICQIIGRTPIVRLNRIPEEYSVERVTLLRAYGAEVILTPRADAMQGAIDKAEEIVRRHPDYFMPQQFRNPANPEVHRKTTAREILDGFGEILKERIKSLRLFGVEPAESPVFSGGKPGPHKIQGIGAGFIPEVFNRRVVDRFIAVSYDDARAAARRLAEQEGILGGISSGAILHASCEVAQELGHGKRLLAILPDSGERYLSTELFS